MQSVVAQVEAALRRKFGSMWQAAAAFDSQYCGGRLVMELHRDPLDPAIADFVSRHTGIDMFAKCWHNEAHPSA